MQVFLEFTKFLLKIYPQIFKHILGYKTCFEEETIYGKITKKLDKVWELYL